MDRMFCHFRLFFTLLLPIDDKKNQNFENIKKNTRRYHFIHVYHKWQLYDVRFLRYGAWRTHFFVILSHFLLFQPLDHLLKKWNIKTPGHTTHVYYKWQSYDVSFWAIFCPFTPLTTRKMKSFKKWKKNTWRYQHFTHVYQKLWAYDVQLLRYGVQQTDGQTYRQKKWHIEVGSHLKTTNVGIGHNTFCPMTQEKLFKDLQ